jgi:hypothetical protein
LRRLYLYFCLNATLKYRNRKPALTLRAIRGNQLWEVKAENTQRQAVGPRHPDNCATSSPNASHRKPTERRAADEKKLIGQVEATFHGTDPRTQQTIMDRWRVAAARDIPQVENARDLWEKDQWDPDAKAWRARDPQHDSVGDGAIGEERESRRGVASPAIRFSRAPGSTR